MTPKKFVSLGKAATDPTFQWSFMTKKFQSCANNKDFLYNYIQALDAAGLNAYVPVGKYLKATPEEDLEKGHNWAILYQHIGNPEGNYFKYILDHRKELALAHGDSVQQ